MESFGKYFMKNLGEGIYNEFIKEKNCICAHFMFKCFPTSGSMNDID